MPTPQTRGSEVALRYGATDVLADAIDLAVKDGGLGVTNINVSHPTREVRGGLQKSVVLESARFSDVSGSIELDATEDNDAVVLSTGKRRYLWYGASGDAAGATREHLAAYFGMEIQCPGDGVVRIDIDLFGDSAVEEGVW